jgi:phosphoglycolate phosphatase-like HAD superfamily hydrolase
MDAVLFDLDGTLLDLPVDIERARRGATALFCARGWSGELRPILPAITAAAAAVTGEPTERRRLEAEARALIDEAELDAAARAIARTGAREAAEMLAGQGLALGIVTDNGRACVGPALAAGGLDHLDWRVVVTRDEVARPKPDPAGVQHAAAALLPRGGLLWLVGDSPRDMQAARAAVVDRVTVRPVGVIGGRGTAAELIAAGAEAVLERLTELLAFADPVADREPSP